ncbi:putative monovalent cation/H+ antiporter subunit B [Caloramator mitchellensis]|uniref:Putative monovalent cation/H+ antiporter subunit B n=1 Tax=Caloramator mitchellensis TaxID=908809 RepID=A0A0R3K4Q2_CALMK|nr:MnhB domain-containing protein [Caloramator mitchellensis]KRQ87922.1 putative monovalent cation/H+ antiporter subunit B [Caloramator mitchellensis]
MRDEKSLFINIVALLILSVMAFYIYKVSIDTGSGIKITDNTTPQMRVADRYLNKNVMDGNSKYEWGGSAENTSANIVTSVVVDYRLFDTTLEVIVLFITILGFGFIMPKDKRKINPSTTILYRWSPILMLLMLMIGGYMFINGHLSPGGGFPAGAIISTAVLTGVLAGRRTLNQKKLKIIEAVAGISIFGLGIASYLITGNFFQNFILNDKIGDLFSAGLIPVFYGLIAFKVAAELSNIYFEFYEEC